MLPMTDLTAALRPKIVAALDGHTKYSRDCNLSGEYLASQVLPIIADALAALERAGKQEGWQTIDKAPTDGTEILVWSKNLILPRPASFADNKWIVFGLWTAAEWEPTHFMPLPAPPPAEGDG